MLADVFGEIDELQKEVADELKERFPDVQEGERHEGLKENRLIQKLRERALNGSSTITDQKAAKTLRSALRLSGGGIRSATFNLGILQGLARHGLLEKFDYLSTVSGGGFIGGWLSAWKQRVGLLKVTKESTAPENTTATGSENRRAPAHLQQLPEPATRFIKRRYLDVDCGIIATSGRTGLYSFRFYSRSCLCPECGRQLSYAAVCTRFLTFSTPGGSGL